METDTKTTTGNTTGPRFPVEMLEQIIACIPTTALPSMMRTNSAMHDLCAPHLYRVIRIPPGDPVKRMRNQFSPAPRSLPLVERIELHGTPWWRPAVCARCAPRTLRIDDCNTHAPSFDLSHLQSVIVERLLDRRWGSKVARWMERKALAITYLIQTASELYEPPSFPDYTRSPDPRISDRATSLRIIVTPTAAGTGPPVQIAAPDTPTILANYLSSLRGSFKVQLVGFELSKRSSLPRSVRDAATAEEASNALRAAIEQEVTEICETRARKGGRKAVMERVEIMDMRTWVEQGCDGEDITLEEAETWVGGWPVA